jgi:hypothetical protein
MAGLHTVGRWRDAAACLLGLVFAGIAWAEPAAEEEISESDYRRRVVAREAKSLTIAVGDDETETVLIDEPVLRWVNPRGAIGGTFLWIDNELPVVMCCVWFAPDKSVHLAFHSLSEEPVKAERDGQILWHSDEPGIAYQEVPDASAPADTAKARLTQMRNIARDFTPQVVFSNQKPEELRLLPQPLYRYGGDDSGIGDGAIFAYVIGTDPELILQIEARPDLQGKPRWQYAITRRTSAELRVLHKSNVVWTAIASQGGFNEPFYVRPAR